MSRFRSPDRARAVAAFWRRPLLIVLAVVAVAGCQVQVAIDTHVDLDGRGELTVGVGLDDEALARVGDLDEQLRLGDLATAGWDLRRPERGRDDLTWLRATKRVGSMEELNRALDEVTGDPGVFRDFRLVAEDGATAVTHRLAGTVDPAAAMPAFADPMLGARLGGDPVAAWVASVEQAEGRPVADLVTVEVGAAIGDGARQVWQPRLDARTPLVIDLAVHAAKPPTSVGGAVPLGSMAVAGVVLVAMLVGARGRFRTAR